MTQRALRLEVRDPAVDTVTATHHAPFYARAPSVLLVPGAGGNLDDAGLVALAQLLARAGHHVVRANLPYREAGHRFPPKAEASVDAYHQVLGAAQRQIGSGPWIVGGKSYGGRVASIAVAQGMTVTGLLFYGYPLHPPGKPGQLRADHWHKVAVPSLFLQGDRDPFCEVALLRANLHKLSGAPTLQLVVGGDHSLRVSRAASPTGTSAAPAVTIAALDEAITAWIATTVPRQTS